MLCVRFSLLPYYMKNTLRVLFVLLTLIPFTVYGESLAIYSFENSSFSSSDQEMNSDATPITALSPGGGFNPDVPVFSGSGNPGSSLAVQRVQR